MEYCINEGKNHRYRTEIFPWEMDTAFMNEKIHHREQKSLHVFFCSRDKKYQIVYYEDLS
jgi:hypothetical protein